MLIEQNILRELMNAEYPDGPHLLHLLVELANEAKNDFVMSRLHIYNTYRTRLRISRETTGIHIDGLAETVVALERSNLDEVRLIFIRTIPAACLAFTDKDLKQVIGILFFQIKNEACNDQSCSIIV